MGQSIQDVNELDPAKKGEEYCRRNAKDIHQYNNNTGFFYNQKIKWLLYRKYARGQQPIDNAKQHLNRKKISYDNLNWNVPKGITIIFDIMVGILSKLDRDITCTSIDPASMRKKDLKRYKAEGEIIARDATKEIESIAQMKIADENSEYGDMEELEIEVDAGMLKLDVEIAMKEVVTSVFDYNKVMQLVPTMTRDGASCGLVIARHYVQKNGLLKVRHVRPENFVSDFVTERDFRDVGKLGEYVTMNMAQLRQIADLKDEDFVKIAEAVANKYGNGQYGPFNNLGPNLGAYLNPYGQGYIFDKYVVKFLYCEWSTTDRYNHVVDKPNEFGNTRTTQMPVGFEHKGEYKKYSKDTDYLVWYRCSWILDTEIVFDYGKVQFPNVKTNALNESQPTFAVCAVDINDMITSTYTERVVEEVDAAYLAWMQYQSHLCKAVPPGIAADILGLTNIPDGRGGTMKPLENVERYTATGNLLMNTLLPNGQIMQRLPMEVLNGSDFTKAALFYDQYWKHIEAAKRNVGINEFMDAGNPDPEQSVQGANYAVQGTINSLHPLISCIDNVIEKIAEGVVNRAQHMAETGQLDYLATAIGNESLMALRITSELSAAAFGIQIAPRADKEDKLRVDGWIQQSLAQRTQTGVGGIEIEDAIAVNRLKDPKAQERLLMKKRELRNKKDMERSRIQQEDNAMVQERSVQAKKQADAELLQLDLAVYKQKAEIDKEKYAFEKQLDHNLRMKEIEAEGRIKDENIVTKGMVDVKVNQAKPEKEVSNG